MMFVFICLCLILLTALLWRSADRRAKSMSPGLARRLTRLAFAAFFAAMVIYPVIPLSRPLFDAEPDIAPAVWSTAAYLWLPVLLPLTIACWMSFGAVVIGRWWFRRARSRRALAPTATISASDQTTESPSSDLVPTPTSKADEQPPEAVGRSDDSPTPPVPGRLTRRQVIGLAAAAIPPVTTVGLTAVALGQRGEFRVRPLTVSIPTLPDELDGLTICHLADLHAGNFVPADMVDRVADAANALACDLVVFTGDLIDRGLLDRLPIGLRLFDRLDRRHGLAVIEGNHDVQANAAEFEQAMRDRNLPFLIDEQVTYEVPGKRTRGLRVKVQFLGIPWGEPKEKSDFGSDAVRPIRDYNEPATAASIGRVAALRRPDAFPILLAHHPHAFDPAVAAGFPLTLAGHTHGGQIMLTPNIGAGPLRFRYWNGVHERNGCQMVISNGLGSWFPLRVNVPAEIVHLTLRRGTPGPM